LNGHELHRDAEEPLQLPVTQRLRAVPNFLEIMDHDHLLFRYEAGHAAEAPIAPTRGARALRRFLAAISVTAAVQTRLPAKIAQKALSWMTNQA
jgi:hypothetical protein